MRVISDVELLRRFEKVTGKQLGMVRTARSNRRRKRNGLRQSATPQIFLVYVNNF